MSLMYVTCKEIALLIKCSHNVMNSVIAPLHVAQLADHSQCALQFSWFEVS